LFCLKVVRIWPYLKNFVAAAKLSNLIVRTK